MSEVSNDVALHNLPDHVLAEMLADSRNSVKIATANLALVENIIQSRFAERIEAAYQAKGEQSGKVRLELDGALSVTGSRTKTVKWDQPAMFAVAESMNPQDAHHWFDFTIDMAEKKFDAMPDSHAAKAKIQAARTVKYGPLKITYEKKES